MHSETATVEPWTAVLAEHTQMRIPSNLDWIEPVVEYLKNKAVLCGACEEPQAGRLFMALHEALTNSIIHGNLEVASHLKDANPELFSSTLAERVANPGYASRMVHIGILYDGHRCQWALTDEGPGFDYEAILNRPEPTEADFGAVSGRGISLMRALVDDVRYEAGGRRVILTLYRTNCPEKRQHSRWPLHQRVLVAPLRSDGSVDWDAGYEAVAKNLSEEGLSLLQTRPSQPERVMVGMDVQGQTVYFPAQVCHCQTVQDNLLEMGCRLLLPKDTAGEADPAAVQLKSAIESLLADRQPRPAEEDEPRQHPRVHYTERIEILSPEGGQPLTGHGRDISRDGMSFLATEPIPLGERILCLPQSGGPLRIRAQIVQCQSIAEGFFDVAARFLELA
jgi:anti-sigma regulatory factor (Ser/Thr protein kinase)